MTLLHSTYYLEKNIWMMDVTLVQTWSMPPPLDVLLCVLEKAYYIPHDSIDYATLYNCSLVCRDWHAAAQSLLVKCVDLHRKVPTHLQPHANHIRLLDVTIGDCYAVPPTAFATFFVSCTHLYGLGVSIRGGLDCFDEDVMDLLSTSPPPFKAFQLKFLGWGSVVAFQLLGLTSSARHLKIQQCWDVIPPS